MGIFKENANLAGMSYAQLNWPCTWRTDTVICHFSSILPKSVTEEQEL